MPVSGKLFNPITDVVAATEWEATGQPNPQRPKQLGFRGFCICVERSRFCGSLTRVFLKNCTCWGSQGCRSTAHHLSVARHLLRVLFFLPWAVCEYLQRHPASRHTQLPHETGDGELIRNCLGTFEDVRSLLSVSRFCKPEIAVPPLSAGLMKPDKLKGHFERPTPVWPASGWQESRSETHA